MMKRQEALETVLELLQKELAVCCNGMVSRETFHAMDRPGNFYMIGSMGLTAAIGLGVCLARPDRRVAVLDGDGNVLMNMGTLAEVGALKPEHFFHFCFDNEVYGSTGNQPTLSRIVDLAEVARAAGYRVVDRVRDRPALKQAATRMLSGHGPGFLLIKVRPEPKYETAGRVSLPPETIRDRFARAVGEPA